MPILTFNYLTTLIQPLTPKERMRRCLWRQPVDRLPVQTNFTGTMGANLAAHFQCTPAELPLRLDNHLLRVTTAHPPRLSANGLISYDWWGAGWGTATEGYWHAEAPLAGATAPAELDAYPWPDPTRNFDRKAVRELAQRLYETTDKGIIMPGFGSGIMEMTLYLQGFDTGFMNMLVDKPLAGYLLDKVTDLKMAYAEQMLEAAGDYCHVIYGGDDLGHQNNLAIRPELFRELMLPRYKRYHSFLKLKAPHIKIFFHSCGCIYELIPDLIEAGVDILNPVQVNAAEMGDTARLKREFGRDITFWGGIDTQHVMPHGTPQEVKEEVKRRINDLAPGGGYVFDTVHNIQADVPGENVIALAEALDEFGWY